MEGRTSGREFHQKWTKAIVRPLEGTTKQESKRISVSYPPPLKSPSSIISPQSISVMWVVR